VNFIGSEQIRTGQDDPIDPRHATVRIRVHETAVCEKNEFSKQHSSSVSCFELSCRRVQLLTRDGFVSDAYNNATLSKISDDGLHRSPLGKSPHPGVLFASRKAQK
jgi:hypothetical protein